MFVKKICIQEFSNVEMQVMVHARHNILNSGRQSTARFQV